VNKNHAREQRTWRLVILTAGFILPLILGAGTHCDTIATTKNTEAFKHCLDKGTDPVICRVGVKGSTL
jgi:hypothetical protein